MGADTSVIVGADHGFAPAWKSVNVNLVLQNAGLYDPANRAASKAIGYVAGGTANIYINLAGLEQGGVVSQTQYSEIRTQIMDAFNNLSDNGTKMTAAVWTKEQTRAIQADGYTINAWHPTRTGDVVVVLQSPYMWDAPTAGQVVADAAFFGQHGYLPDAVDLSRNINMHAMFGLAGPGVARGKRIPAPRAIDLAPTAAYALGILPPRHSEGRVLTEAFSDESPTLVPIQVLSWSDYHAQLDPITVTVDRVSVPSGGVAILGAYWNEWKARNPQGTIILGSGDNVGATPPNSAFLGDVPGIQAMNLMGFTASATGNHEFDKGVTGLQPLLQLAQFPYLATNIVDANGQIPSYLKPYIVVKANGIDVGIIGTGNEDTPTVTNPQGLQGLRFLDPIESTNRYVRELVGQGVRTIIVVYHQGAASGDFDNQTGPLADMARAVDPEVDVIIGGHNRVNTMTRINGILVHEGNHAQTTGRITLLVDPATKNVTAAWGAFDRPYGGAITPEPRLAQLVSDANEQIKPILGQQIGASAALVDRSRGAESKMGNLVSDAIRATYGVDVALQNSGGLRADFRPGPLTRGDVFAVLPFGNLVVTGKLSGADLLAALENGVSDVSGSAGRFIQLSGVRFAYDASKPVGQRVLWAVLSNGQPLDPNATYTVAANDFMWYGGDGYTSLTKLTDAFTREQLYEVAVNYVQSLGTVDPQTEGRIIAAQAGQPAPTPPTAATPVLPTPAGTLPTAVPATAVPTVPAGPGMTPAPVPTTGPPPGMPVTGAGDGPANWLPLLLAAALLLSLGLLLARRHATR
jgi:2',3'-cyclic-nucleotide 2'-phosphodiesterase (5'-nucleotidase family)